MNPFEDDALKYSMCSVDGAACLLRPVSETVEAIVVSDSVLSTDLFGPGQKRSSLSESHGRESPHGLRSSSFEDSASYVVLLSGGGTRQLAFPDMTLLDSSTFPLPALPGGRVLQTLLVKEFFLVVYPSAAHVSTRRDVALSAFSSTPFQGKASATNVLTVQDELCLCVLRTDLVLQMMALPNLHLLCTLNLGEFASPLSLREPGRAVICSDGQIVLRVGGANEVRLWSTSCLSGRSRDTSRKEAQERIEASLRDWQPPWKLSESARGSWLGSFSSSKPLRDCVVACCPDKSPKTVDRSPRNAISPPSFGSLTSQSLAHHEERLLKQQVTARNSSGGETPSLFRDATPPKRESQVATANAFAGAQMAGRAAHERTQHLDNLADRARMMSTTAAQFERDTRQLEKNSRWSLHR